MSFFCSFLFILGLFSSVWCQLCTERVVTTRWVPQTYTHTYRETYDGHCWFRCVRTRLASYTDSKWVPRKFVDMKNVCCDGYIQRDEELSDTIQCDPICIPACKNGFCGKPGECQCNEGYIFENGSTYVCIPLCKGGCGHGHCTAPDVCDCNFGYIFQNDTCQPICSEPCVNGTCTAPDTCECNIGYRKSEDNNCSPYCSKGCTHGTCVSPEVCQCIVGYKMSGDTCIPHCEIDCGQGNCTAPNECSCHPGHKIENDTCIPHCTSCDHGKCIAPNICECDEGWSNTTGICQPNCSFPCGNGTCIAPDECQCFSGYNNSANGDCIPHCSQCIHGTCVSPEVCECDAGWTKNEADVCVPFCRTACGKGLCIQPDLCECNPGYKVTTLSHGDKLNNSEVCVPDCGSCNGTCVEPNKCVCEYPFGPGFDPDCTDTECNVTHCVLESTTSTEKITSNNDDSSAVEIITKAFDTSVNIEDRFASEGTTSEMDFSETATEDSAIYSHNVNLSTNKGFPYWIYIVILCVILVAVVSAFLYIKRRKLSRFFNGGSYVVEEADASQERNSQTMSCNITYSEIKKRKDNLQ